MPLQATSGAASYDAFGGGVAAVPKYIEEYFSTFLYTGTGAQLDIVNGIDLSTKGGMVWLKPRTTTTYQDNMVYDTARGVNNWMMTNTTGQAFTVGTNLQAFNTNGFQLGSSVRQNASGVSNVSWTFAKASKFFDVVTYTGNGTAGRTVSHNLGSTPACMIVKDTTNAGSAWAIYHTSLGNTQYLQFTTSAAGTSSGYWNNTTPTSTEFTVGTNGNVNLSGATYVAYLFAHNAGGFGLTGTDNVISCGSFDANLGEVINLGYEPQWLLYKDSVSVSNWRIADTMRGLTNLAGTNAQTIQQLVPNSTAIEGANSGPVLTSTGFTWNQSGGGNKHIYIAIRRGPMKVPTSGTSVFTSIYQTPQSAGTLRTVGFPADLMIGTYTAAATPRYVNTRLTGLANNSGSAQTTPKLQTQSTAAESNAYPLFYDVWNTTARDGDYIFGSNGINWMFGRAPSFFDVVCYTGTGSNTTFTHNLGVAPELMIFKRRDTTANWRVYSSSQPASDLGTLNSNIYFQTDSNVLNSTAPTSSVFTVGTNAQTNASGGTYVAYLFATTAGVSKVGSYTGTGTTLQINCGFTGGSRFVLIKRVDDSADWYVWDSARGIVAGNDSYLLLNSTAAEVTNTDYIDTYSAGFEISSTAPAAINASGGSFIFFAVA